MFEIYFTSLGKDHLTQLKVSNMTGLYPIHDVTLKSGVS